MAKVIERAGGFWLEPVLAPAERWPYWLGAGVLLTLLWGGFVLLLLAVPFNIWLYLLLVLFSILVAARAPEGGLLALVLTTMLFESFFTLQPIVMGENVYKFYFIDALLVITLGAFVWRGRFAGWRLTRLDRAVLIFDGAMALYFLASFFIFGSDAELAFSAFKTLVFYSVIYFLVKALLFERGGREALVSTLLFGGLGILAFFFIGLVTGQGPWALATPLSTAGSRLLAPAHAFYLLFPLLILVSHYHLPPRLIKDAGLRLVLTWLWLLGIVFSLARHLWLVLMVQAVLLARHFAFVRQTLTDYFRAPLAAAAVLAVVIFGAAAIVPGSLGEVKPLAGMQSLALRVGSLFSSEDVSINWRLALWRESFSQFLNHPLFGVGLGQAITFPLSNYTLTVPVREMHNSLFALLVQTGLIGFGFFIWLMYEAFRGLRWFVREQAVPAAALAGVLAAALFGTYFEANFLIVFFWLALGWLAAAKVQ